jgi:DNA-binding transcriptional regulator YiaG
VRPGRNRGAIAYKLCSIVPRCTVLTYQTPGGNAPLDEYFAELSGAAAIKAAALVKLLEALGHELRLRDDETTPRVAECRLRRFQRTEERPVIMPLTNSTVAAIDQPTKDDPDFAAAVEAELQAMHIEQELVALRNASGLSQRQLAAKLGVKQPVIAKLEAGRNRNVGLQTLVRVVKAMNGRIKVAITPAERRVTPGRKRTVISRKAVSRSR